MSSEVRRVQVAVAVADDARGCIYEVAAACRALGLDHTITLTTVGIVMGSVKVTQLEKLSAVAGVIAVEVKSPFRSPVPETVH
jgi:hypothetical protein